jgi:hypothetical protein
MNSATNILHCRTSVAASSAEDFRDEVYELLGLFFFKDVISLGASFYLIRYFGKRAILSENTANN